ncbi:MAG: DUF177 domain-containing protein [Bacillota bacterium]|nr:DUF177 domain-containing protein [Bacillota bacterium]
MKIKVDKLKNVAGIRSELEFTLSPEDAADSDLQLGSAPLVFKGAAENLDRVIEVTGTVEAVLKGVCDRCGEDLEYKVLADFSETFTNLADKLPDEDDGEKCFHLFNGDEIDLWPYVEQAIFLAKPMKILCKEDCRGLCPQCGQNLNLEDCSCDNDPIDPRLAVLADLLKEIDD